MPPIQHLEEPVREALRQGEHEALRQAARLLLRGGVPELGEDEVREKDGAAPGPRRHTQGPHPLTFPGKKPARNSPLVGYFMANGEKSQRKFFGLQPVTFEGKPISHYPGP